MFRQQVIIAQEIPVKEWRPLMKRILMTGDTTLTVEIYNRMSPLQKEIYRDTRLTLKNIKQND